MTSSSQTWGYCELLCAFLETVLKNNWGKKMGLCALWRRHDTSSATPEPTERERVSSDDEWSTQRIGHANILTHSYGQAPRPPSLSDVPAKTKVTWLQAISFAMSCILIKSQGPHWNSSSIFAPSSELPLWLLDWVYVRGVSTVFPCDQHRLGRCPCVFPQKHRINRQRREETFSGPVSYA